MKLRSLMPLCALVFTVSAPAFAQEQGAQGEIEASTDLDPREMTVFASQALEEMRTADAQISKLLAEAERKGDALTISCLTKKQASVRSLIQVTEAHSVTMNSAIADDDSEGAAKEFRVIAVSLSKARQFRAEAEACSGGGDGKDGETIVDVEGDAWGLTDDTSGLDDGNTDVGTDPPGTTPFE